MQPLNPSITTAGIETPAVARAENIVLTGKKVLVGLPSYKSMHPATAMTIMQLVDRRKTSSLLHYGDAFVTHSRNSLADAFLMTDLEWLLMVDDDMIVPFGDARWFKQFTGWKDFPEPFASINALDRLLMSGKTLVGSAYRGRYPHSGIVYNEAAVPGAEHDYASGGPYDVVKPTRWVGTGCILIHRSVFLDIEKMFPILARGANGRGGQWFSASEHNLLNSVVNLRSMLLAGPMDSNKSVKALEQVEAMLADARSNSGISSGEDVTFCRRAQQAGHQPYVDLGCWCGHAGQRIYGPTRFQ